MKNDPFNFSCADCDRAGRREFLKTASIGGFGLMAATVASGGIASTFAPHYSGKGFIGEEPEKLVAEFYESLTSTQKSTISFDFDHPLRSKVDNNWRITRPRISEFFNRDQQAMIEGIFHGVHNLEYIDRVMDHIREDGGSLGNYSVAVFGRPGTGKFEFVLTGRHCTMRCDGDSVEGAAFGGPIFYGHASQSSTEKPDHPGNVYWFQAKRANEVFQALDGKQRERALLGSPRSEQGTLTVELKSGQEEMAGLPGSEMSRDQRELVGKVLADLLLPFRRKDSEEAMRYIKKNGDVDSLHLSFYKNLDIGSDGVWDVWQLESKNMIWYFRGHPHVHVWVNIRA